jgi:N-acetylglucosaminyldiphosphoundecaprenol N-acetyl-beta-D-mannosaminyltransferase
VTAGAVRSATTPASDWDDVPVYEMLGTRVAAFDEARLNECVASAIARDQRIVIATHNLHSLYLHGRDAKFRAFYAATDVCHPDGMSVILLGRTLGLPLSGRHRVTYMHWIESLMAESVRRGWRVFALGGRPGVFEQAAQRLRAAYPGLLLDGTHGYFDATPGSAETAAVLERIAAFRPNVLVVGMSMPRQEHWVHDNRAALSANVTLIAGATMDFVAGVVPRPPRAVSAAGLGWLWRLIIEPRRLWRRYLVEPWWVMGRVISEWAGRRPRGDQ